MISQLTSIFKALGEPTRLKIVRLLSTQELYLCELAEVLDMSQPRVSQHIKVLKNAGIIQERKQGQRSFFKVDSQIASGRLVLFQQLMDSDLNRLNEFTMEFERLNELPDNSVVIECKNNAPSEIKIIDD